MKTRRVFLAGLLLPLLSLSGVVSSHADVTGTWLATLPGSGSSRVLTLQLHQRADGKVLGYIPGGTAQRVVTGGSVSGDSIHLDMEFKDPRVTEIFTLDGSVRRNLIHGTADDGSGPRPIVLHRAAGVLHERRFLFAKPPIGPGEPTGVVDLSVVLGRRDRLVSGGFISQTDCSLFACGGGVTSFSETGSTITVELETGGACPGSGSFTATFDSTTRFYSGTYAFTSCAGTDSGALIGVRSTRTQTDHVGGILAALGRIADDLQARITFTAPYAPVSTHYFHTGKTQADLLAGFNAEVATYDSIDVILNRFRNFKTVNDPDTLPDVDTPIGVDFRDRRTGVPLGGGSGVTFRDADTSTGVPSDTELKFFAEEAGAWVVIGNGEPSCAAPLFSVLPVSETAIRFVTTVGGFNPPSHTVPSDHPGIYLNGTGVSLVSPGNLRLTGISRATYLVSPFRQGLSDHAIDFSVCGSIHGRFGHVVTLIDGLAARLTGGSCTTYNTADEQVESCRFPVDTSVSAGDALGTVGGATAGAFDFGLYDDNHRNAYVNPSRVHDATLHSICPYDYFEPTPREFLLSHVGNGVSFRTEEPRCGTMEIDAAGTAQGLWVTESSPVQQAGDESFFVSLAPDTLTPSTAQLLSIGPASLGAGLMKVITQHSGRVNRAFSEVGPDGLIYCYTGISSFPPRSYFVSLGGDGRLSIEKLDHGSGSGPCVNDPATWAFSSNRVAFVR